MKTTIETYDYETKRMINKEIYDEKGNLIYFENCEKTGDLVNLVKEMEYSDKNESDIKEMSEGGGCFNTIHQNRDLGCAKDYVSKETEYFKSNKPNSSSNINERKITTYTFMCNNCIPTSITFEKYDNEKNVMVVDRKYEFEIATNYYNQPEYKLNFYEIVCRDNMSNKKIVYRISKLSSLAPCVIIHDEINNMMTVSDTSIEGDCIECLYKKKTVTTILYDEDGKEKDVKKVNTYIYDNGLYEKEFTFDEKDNIVIGKIRTYSLEGGFLHLMTEYTVDEDFNLIGAEYFEYDYYNGVFLGTHNRDGGIMTYVETYDGDIEREYPPAFVSFNQEGYLTTEMNS